jgi:tetratricopeptide (TPR) repeat protein
MVYIARGDLDRAASVLREGTIAQDRQAHLRLRFPARGLHWLLGMVLLAQGQDEEARGEFRREMEGGSALLYASEFSMNACDGAGFAALRAGEHGEAAAMFERALGLYPQHARSLIGLGAALAAQGDSAEAAGAFARAEKAIEGLRHGGRGGEATLAEAFLHAVHGRTGEAIEAVRRLVERPAPPFTGWTVPVEPLLAPLRHLPAFAAIRARLTDNAR